MICVIYVLHVHLHKNVLPKIIPQSTSIRETLLAIHYTTNIWIGAPGRARNRAQPSRDLKIRERTGLWHSQ